MEHRKIPKKLRERVWNKFGRRCAYCGCPLEYKDMQVDHAVSVLRTSIDNGGAAAQDDSFENLMPSCRNCNYYKEAKDIEEFRESIRDVLQRTCVDTPQARLAIKYGIITVNKWNQKFWFEKMSEEQ